MPELFRKECEDNGVKAEVDSVTAGGYMLSQFLSDEDEHAQRLKRLFEEKRYDYVVLQEQSVKPAVDTEAFLKDASELAAKPVLYETWGRADGSKTLSDLGLTHDEMQDKLRAAYETAAKRTGAILVYAGDAFHKAYREGKDVFDPDGSHPSPYGSQIIAEEFCRKCRGDH